MSAITRRELAPGVVLYVTRTPPSSDITYEIEIAKLAAVEFTTDFTGSSNVRLSTSPTLSSTVIVNPYERKLIGILSVVNPRSPTAIATKYSWKEGPPNPDILRKIASEDADKIKAELYKAMRLKLDADSLSMDRLSAVCKSNGMQFIDPEFPPLPSSLHTHTPTTPTPATDPSIETKAGDDGGDDTSINNNAAIITWRRPGQFLKPGYQVVEDGVTPLDIRQGSLGNCWLLCAFSALAEFPEYVHQLFVSREDAGVPTLTVNPTGVYTVKLCVNGEWQFIRVDDYIPCSPAGGPVYAKAHGDELWVMLLEKAFAKVYGCYKALEGGMAYEALMMLTGCPTSKYYFDAPDVAAKLKSGELFNMMREFDECEYLLSCSTPGEDKWTGTGTVPSGGPGLVTGHAYTILQVKQTSTGEKLLEIRNPWGNFEWNGDWGDASTKWTPRIRDELRPSLNPDDGKFWMSYGDFQRYFNGLNVCRLHPPTGPRGKWNEKRRKGRFHLVDSGDVECDLFLLTVEEAAPNVWVSVHQPDDRITGSKPYIDIGVTVLQQLSDGSRVVIGSTGVEVDRQSQLSVSLQPGQYYVVPFTTGCKLAQQRRRGGEPTQTISRMKLVAPNGELSNPCVFALREMFDALDVNMDDHLDSSELSEFLLHSEGMEMSGEVYQWLLKTFDSSRDGLTADGFVELYKWMYGAAGNDEGVIWKDLEYMGYDERLEQVKSRGYVLSVHADTPKFELARIPFDDTLHEDGVELPVVQRGERKELFNGKVTQFTLRSGYWGVSIAVRNNTTQPIAVTVDCSASTNVMSHQPSGLRATINLRPSQVEIAHHLMPLTQSAWSFGVAMSLGR